MFPEIVKKRRDAFNHMEERLEVVKRIAKETDADCRVYLFGSVARGRHNVASDIDILIVSEGDKYALLSKLEKAGIEFPFELHIRNTEESKPYFRHVHEMKEL